MGTIFVFVWSFANRHMKAATKTSNLTMHLYTFQLETTVTSGSLDHELSTTYDIAKLQIDR
jgi:hypothetical protein